MYIAISASDNCIITNNTTKIQYILNVCGVSYRFLLIFRMTHSEKHIKNKKKSANCKLIISLFISNLFISDKQYKQVCKLHINTENHRISADNQ